MAKLGCCSGSGAGSRSGSGGMGVNDAVCVSALIGDGTTLIPIWENTTKFKMNGTVLFENHSEADGWTVKLIIVRDTIPTPVEMVVKPGESVAMSIDRLKDMHVVGVGPETPNPDAPPFDDTKVTASFSLNYVY